MKIGGILKNKKVLWFAAGALVLVFAGILARGFGKKEEINSGVIAGRRDITAAITTTAAIGPKDQYSIISLVSGDVVYADFEEGDTVEKGELLYKINSRDIEKTISSSDVSLRQAQLGFRDALKSRDDLKVVSDCFGIVRTVYVKPGDMVAAGSKIADVYDGGSMEIVLPFNAGDVSQIHAGARAEVKISRGGEVLSGAVSEIKSAVYAKEGNMLVRDVVIRVENPGALTAGEAASAAIGTVFSNDTGKLQYAAEKTIVSKTAGEVLKINITEGNYAAEGDVLVTLRNDALDSAADGARLSLEAAKIARAKAADQLENYTITAPISGTVVSKTVKAGDKLDTTTMSMVMAVIYDLSSLKFEMNVDELDINKIAQGQEVSVKADALGGKEYTGFVSNISISGKTANGVTTYPVTVEIEGFDGQLLPGMNVDAEIVIEKRENVIAVPVGAVSRGNVVFVRGKKTDEGDGAPEGYRSVKVETGVYNDDYIEIKLGVSEGDVVFVEFAASDLEENMQKMMRARPSF